MNLVMIGGKNPDGMKKSLLDNIDNLKVEAYPDLWDFINAANIRTLQVDRILLLRDRVEEGSDAHSAIVNFNEYLENNFPSIRLITLVKDEESLDVLANTFVSPFMVNICIASSMKSTMLLELVALPIDQVKKKYAEEQSRRKTAGIIGEEVALENSREAKQRGKKPKKEKKGLFNGLFAKKPKKGKLEAIPPVEGIEEGAEALVGAVAVEEGVPEGVIGGITSMDEEPFNFAEEDFDFPSDEEMEDNPFLEEDVKTEEVAEEESEEVDNPFGDLDDDDLSPFELEEEEETQEEIKPEELMVEEPVIEPIIEEVLEPEPTFFEGSGLDLEIEEEVKQEETQPIALEMGADKKLEEIKESFFNTTIIDEVLDVPIITNNVVDLHTAETPDPILEDMDSVLKEFESKSRKERIVEKVVEKVVEVPVEKVVEVPVEVEKVIIKGAGKRRAGGVRTVIVTGDRKSGVTRSALNTAFQLAKEGSTLFVDFDINRKGSYHYLDFDRIISQPERVNSGLSFAKNPDYLDEITYNYRQGGFECLLSDFEYDEKRNSIKDIQLVLSKQRIYKNIIIDCPIEHLHKLEDIIIYSDILICTDSNIPSMLNTVISLSNVNAEEQDKYLSFIYNNGQFLLDDDADEKEFDKNIKYIEKMFSLDSQVVNWATMPVIGSMGDMEQVVASIG